MKRTENGEEYKKNNPEAFKKLSKAMEMSKGNVDTVLGRELAKIPDATPEDIVRLQTVGEETIYGSHDVWHKSEQRSESLRNTQKKEKFRYCFKETFAYRYLDKFGLAEKVVEKRHLHKAIVSKSIAVDEVHADGEYDINRRGRNAQFLRKAGNYQYSELIDEFKSLIQTPASIREDIFKDDFLLDVWTSGRKHLCDYPYWQAVSNYHTLTDEQKQKMTQDYHKKQNEKKAEELIMLKFAPQDVKDKIAKRLSDDKEQQAKAKERGHYYGSRYEFVTMSEVWYDNTRLAPWKLERELELEDFYKALKYMGLGLVCVEDAHAYEKKNIRQFISHVNATTRQFVSDIKKGFSPRDVQEMVKEDLNLWLSQRVKDKWTVFVRTDAPTTYPDIEPKKKTKPSLKDKAEVFTKEGEALVRYLKQQMGEV